MVRNTSVSVGGAGCGRVRVKELYCASTEAEQAHYRRSHRCRVPNRVLSKQQNEVSRRYCTRCMSVEGCLNSM